MGLIGALQVFALPYVLTDGAGGPARSTLFYTMYLYNSAFRYLRMGYACAMAWLLFLIILGLTLLVYRLSRKRVHYGR
jgi:multiple sugar transport system permease protein